MSYNKYSQKSTGFIVDELITVCFKIKDGRLGNEMDLLEHKRDSLAGLLCSKVEMLGDFVQESILGWGCCPHSFPENIHLRYSVTELIKTSWECFDAQEGIMDESLPVQERLDCAIMAQRMNAERNRLIREIDTILGELDISVSGKTYTYFEGKDE